MMQLTPIFERFQKIYENIKRLQIIWSISKSNNIGDLCIEISEILKKQTTQEVENSYIRNTSICIPNR